MPFVLLLETPPRGSLSLGARCFPARAPLLSGAVRLPPRLLRFSFTAVCASAVCVFSRATRVPRPRALSLFLYRADARVRAPFARPAVERGADAAAGAPRALTASSTRATARRPRDETSAAYRVSF